MHNLGERTGQVWQDNSRRVRTHEKNSGETVGRLDTIILGLQPRDKAAMLGVKTKEYFLEEFT